MSHIQTAITVLVLGIAASAAQSQQATPLSQSIQAQLPTLIETYKDLHRHPELSTHEDRTAATVAADLRKLGYTVTEHIGRYDNGSPALGVVAILENGAGPRLLIRTELDALPVEEKTGVDRMPTVTLSDTLPPTYNDPAFAARLRPVAVAALGREHVLDATAIMASEDIGYFSLDGKIPAVMFWLGAADPVQLQQSRATGIALPSPHSPLFAPDYEPAIRTGVTALTAMALDILK